MHVFIKYPDRWVLVLTKPSQTERNLIVGLQIHQGGTWQDVADLLALQRTIKSNPLGKLFGQVSANTNKSQQLD